MMILVIELHHVLKEAFWWRRRDETYNANEENSVGDKDSLTYDVSCNNYGDNSKESSDKNSNDTSCLFDGDDDLSKIPEDFLFWLWDKTVQKPQKYQNQYTEEVTENWLEENIKKEPQKHHNQW